MRYPTWSSLPGPLPVTRQTGRVALGCSRPAPWSRSRPLSSVRSNAPRRQFLRRPSCPRSLLYTSTTRAPPPMRSRIRLELDVEGLARSHEVFSGASYRERMYVCLCVRRLDYPEPRPHTTGSFILGTSSWTDGVNCPPRLRSPVGSNAPGVHGAGCSWAAAVCEPRRGWRHGIVVTRPAPVGQVTFARSSRRRERNSARTREPDDGEVPWPDHRSPVRRAFGSAVAV